MATAMHEATASRLRSVAEGMFWGLVPYPKTPGSDDKLYGLVEVCCREAEEVVKAAEPDKWCFGVAVTVSGRWAVEAAKSISMEDYPKTKKRLARYITDAWLGTKEIRDEQFFAEQLRWWAPKEAKQAADAVREIIEFRADGCKNLLDKLGRFFITIYQSPTEEGADEIWRTVFKSLGKYAATSDCVLMGRAYYLLKNDASFSDSFPGLVADTMLKKS